jgi:cytochrome o ubiquinol oxidase subunit 1
LAVWGAVVARSFVRHTTRVIPAADVRRTQERWLEAVSQAPCISRDDEFTPRNRGHAEALAA